MIALCKLAQFVKRVLGDTEHHNILRFQPSKIISKIAGLSGASGRHRGRVEVQYNPAAGIKHVSQVD